MNAASISRADCTSLANTKARLQGQNLKYWSTTSPVKCDSVIRARMAFVLTSPLAVIGRLLMSMSLNGAL